MLCGGFFVYAMEFVLNKKIKPLYSVIFTLGVMTTALVFRSNIESFLTLSTFELIAAVILLGLMPITVVLFAVLQRRKKGDKIQK